MVSELSNRETETEEEVGRGWGGQRRRQHGQRWQKWQVRAIL